MKNKNIATSQHRNIATSQHRNIATSQHRNIATSQHRNIATSGWRLTWSSALLLTATLLSLALLEQSQAQMLVNVYPSQDNTNQTVWIFSGSSSTTYAGTTSIRSSGNWNLRDSMAIESNAGDLYNANRPNNQLLTLSPLLSSTNSQDIESVQKSIPGGEWLQRFAASATNTPTITIAGRGTRTIARLWMDESAYTVGQSGRDGWGIRIQSPNLLYGSGEASSWVGAGILNKPIGDFYTRNFTSIGGRLPTFTSSLTITVHSQIIPEPEEYALVFALFALGFVFFHRRRMQKKRPAISTS